MVGNREAEQAFADLRQLAAENPREARAVFCRLLDEGTPLLDEVLERVAAPGEGRLRQLIANAVRTRPDKNRVVPHLLTWRRAETDEFARRAIEAALEGEDGSAYEPEDQRSLASAALIEAYRYAAGRIRHQLRNDLMRPGAYLLKLQHAVSRVVDASLRTELAALATALDGSLRAVERNTGIETDNQYFRMRPILVLDWVASMNAAYGQKYESVALTIENNAGGAPRVVASDFLLHSIFWNLWVNAQQAIDGECEIRLLVSRAGEAVVLTVLDNGPGFAELAQGVAFQDRYSSNGPLRGRGLLEVQEAVEQLQGTARLVQHRDGSHRVQVTLPWSTP